MQRKTFPPLQCKTTPKLLFHHINNSGVVFENGKCRECINTRSKQKSKQEYVYGTAIIHGKKDTYLRICCKEEKEWRLV